MKKLKKGDWVWFVNWTLIEPRGVLSGVIIHDDEEYQDCYILPVGEVEPLCVLCDWIYRKEEEALEIFRKYSSVKKIEVDKRDPLSLK